MSDLMRAVRRRLSKVARMLGLRGAPLREYNSRLRKRDISTWIPPQDLPGPKFHPNGDVKPFYGLTCIVWIDRKFELFRKLCDLQKALGEEFEQAGLGGVFAFLEPESFHMTICDIDADPDPTEIQLNDRLAQVQRAFRQIGKPGKVTSFIKGIGLKQTITALVTFDSEDELETVLDMERTIKHSTGKNPRDFTGHISLAYLVQHPGNDTNKIKEILLPYEDLVCGEFTFSQFDLTFFTNMNTYLPKLTVNLEHGTVTCQDRSKVILGTHLRGGRPKSSLSRVFQFLSRIAKRAGCTDWSVLILEQPRNKPILEERQKDKVAWEKAAGELEGPLTLVYDLDYAIGEPVTLAWNKLQRYAFEILQANVFVYVDPNPPKWDDSDREAIEIKLAELVVQAQSMDYVIGDYTPVVGRREKGVARKQRDAEFKIIIEEGVKQMLIDRFPSLLAGWSLFDNLKRPRSEFHALSRRLYDKLKKLSPIPYDYGLQMLLVARTEGLDICCENLGKVPVTKADKYSSRKMMHQLRRVDFQLAQIQEWLAASQSKEKKEYQFLHQTSILERLFASHNNLTSLFKMMRVDYYDRERDDCVIWLTGRASDTEPVLKIDHRFFLVSDDIGLGISIHPEDSLKAAIPAYHPHQTETITVVDGDVVLECFNGEGEVVVKSFQKGSSVTISHRECHRVARDPEKEKAYIFVKTNLGAEPDKAQCDNCEIAVVDNCPLRNRWIDDNKALECRGYKTEGHQPRPGIYMDEITNSKLLPTGRFKPFPGFSLLFDNPGQDNFSPMTDNFWKIDCKVHTDSRLGLYSKLKTGVGKIVLPAPLPRFSFFELPAYSYHVTAWDGLNAGNKETVFKDYRTDLANFLIGLPGTLRLSSKFTSLPESSPLVGGWNITFKFAKLSVFGNNVLVARLKPADEKSQHICNEIKKLRRKLYKEFESEFGLGDWRSSYDPHISLGYFGNEQSGKAAASLLHHWTKAFLKEVGSEPINFSSINLYGFLDMETYFKTKTHS